MSEPHLVFSPRGAEQWNKLNDFQRAMARLDALLTGKTVEFVVLSGTARNQATDGNIAEWFIYVHMWYLSDGGYSRLYCDDEGELYLGSESLDTTKARWDDPRVKEARLAVERVIKAIVFGGR